jgi:hypothetical protein
MYCYEGMRNILKYFVRHLAVVWMSVTGQGRQSINFESTVWISIWQYIISLVVSGGLYAFPMGIVWLVKKMKIIDDIILCCDNNNKITQGIALFKKSYLINGLLYTCIDLNVCIRRLYCPPSYVLATKKPRIPIGNA